MHIRSDNRNIVLLSHLHRLPTLHLLQNFLRQLPTRHPLIPQQNFSKLPVAKRPTLRILCFNHPIRAKRDPLSRTHLHCRHRILCLPRQCPPSPPSCNIHPIRSSSFHYPSGQWPRLLPSTTFFSFATGVLTGESE